MMLNKFRVARSGRLPIFGLVLYGALMFFVQLPVCTAQNVTLTWNPSGATNLAGYKIYAGTMSHNYSTTTTVTGITTNTAISGLVQGKTYYFAATTYDSVGNESALSAETSYTVPVAPNTLGAATRTAGTFSFPVSGTIGSQYVVQASTNLVNWVSIQTNTAPFTCVDTNAACFNQRYYRTYYLSP